MAENRKNPQSSTDEKPASSLLGPDTFWELGEKGEFFLALGLAFFLNAALRLIEYGPWQHDAYWIGGEPLMATHDAYAWLAGAKGVGSYVHWAFTGIIRWLHVITGLSLGIIGFWLPVLLIPWVAVPACLLARFMRLTEGGVLFSVLAASSIGFLARTRLGFCDTDLVALLFPVAFVCALVVWITTQTRESWRPDALLAESKQSWSLVMLALTGICGFLSMFFYPQSGSILLAVLGMAALLSLVLTPPQKWVELWVGLLMVYALTYGGLVGLGAVLGLGAIFWIKPNLWKQRNGWLIFTLAALVIFIYAGLHTKVLTYGQAIVGYSKNVTEEVRVSALKLPGITQSVREAQNVPWADLAMRMTGHGYLFFLGLGFYFFAVYRRPQLLLFLPFLGLSIASVQLGNRFAMFGGVALGAGFGLGLAEVMRLLGQSQGRRWIAQLILCVAVFWPMGKFMQNTSPIPVLPNVYAQAFLDLREKTKPDSRLWQWWDYGYAGQYYAERLTFADGGAHDGPWLYPLAKIHSTSSPMLASQLMKYVTQVQRDAAVQAKALGAESQSNDVQQLEDDQVLPKKYYWSNPVATLEDMGPEEATRFVDSLSSAPLILDADLPDQYFVVSWENFRLSYWISFYGHWDLITGQGAPGRMHLMSGQFSVDQETGVILVQGQQIPVDSLDILEADNAREYTTWPNGSGLHLLINSLANQAYLMEKKMYDSLMVQMLIADPDSFNPHFELVDDLYPWVRVYKAI
ncbi:MAG: hypothetical protein RBR42_02675 [Desulfomicrobium sp.]|nr:hypothetical protein [Desulfomicrobium sp.]